jgi:hypothetical protein
VNGWGLREKFYVCKISKMELRAEEIKNTSKMTKGFHCESVGERRAMKIYRSRHVVYIIIFLFLS